MTRRDQPDRFDVTLVLPTFREYTFEHSLDALLGHLAEHPLGATEILVVDDSDEATQAQMEALIASRDGAGGPAVAVKLLRGPRRGKGAAVRAGALASRGEFVFLMDADLPIPLAHLGEFVQLLRDGADVVIAERPTDRYKGDPLRQFMSRALYLLQTSVVFGSRRFADTQCGFKGFRGDFIRRLASLQVVDGGMYDLEYLYVATRLARRIVQVPVIANAELRPSRINVWRCLRVDPVDIGRFKWQGVRGHYDR